MNDPKLFGLDFSDLGLPTGPEHTCPYLTGQMARERAFAADRLPFGVYRCLMDQGWRRSGRVLYKPSCAGCSQCRPIRIAVKDFQLNRTQRRLLKRNGHLEAHVRAPVPTEEKFHLFLRYQRGRHVGDMCSTWEEFSGFLYESPLETLEVCFWDNDELIGCAIVDVDFDCLSSVYTYFAPEMPERSLGTWAILWLIQFARSRRLSHYYLGYYIPDCRKMNYKTNFRPCEIADAKGEWHRLT
ncbi:MAG: arginyltransferase [Sumerlaeia bacterium]